jgi:hypothetical protein
MPTKQTQMRLGEDLLDAARRALGLPADTPVSQVVRAALERLIGNPTSMGEPADRGGRPPKDLTRT